MIENINWYPGHMKKTRELIRDNLKVVDAAVEVIDARIPVSSRNPIIDELLGAKPRIIAFNKSDLADEEANRAWISHFRGQGMTAVMTNCNRGDGIKQLLAKLAEEESRKFEGAEHHRPFRLMIVGVPNVGKSSLINRLTGRKSTQVGDRPGVTKGKQWLTLSNGMQLLDTPGILWPKFEDPKVGMKLAYCGSIKDEILDRADLALELIGELRERYPEELCARYKMEAEEMGDMPLDTMETIAAKRGFLLPGKRIDYERTAATVLDEFRSGTIGRITLELPPAGK